MKLLMSPSVSAQALFYQWQIWEETSRAVQQHDDDDCDCDGDDDGDGDSDGGGDDAPE